jgi:hypothetical protein
MAETKFRRSFRRPLFFLLLIVIFAGVTLLALTLQVVIPVSSSSLQAGQVAYQDILAPTDITFTSEVRTQQQREAAARAVQPVYTLPDTSIARRQLEQMRTALTFITSVRLDAFASTEAKLNDLAALDEIHLQQDTASRILALSESRWQAVQQEAISVLEQVMRGVIRDDRLEDARRNIPSLVSLSLTEEQSQIVAELTAAFVAPNSFYSGDLTEAARQAAADAVTPVMRTFKSGETVVQRGAIVSELDVEALREMGLSQPVLDWKDLVSVLGLLILSLTFLILFLRRSRALNRDLRGLTLVTVLFLAFLMIGRLVAYGSPSLAYIFPLAAYGMTVAVLFGTQPALISSLPVSILVAFQLPNALELTTFYILTSYFGVMSLGRARRVTAFFMAGAAITASGALITIIYRLPDAATDWTTLATLSGASLLNGIASAALGVLLQFFLAQFMGMTTALQLMELSRADHPLLQEMLRNIPGTYQHSLQVANLAEQAAERIGADTLLTRVGAVYHDTGKLSNPQFFIENQLPGSPNPHDSLDPMTSAEIIIRHVTEGVTLAAKHRLPQRICDFILEHHGTMLTRYQYVKAVEAAGGDESQVDVEQFRYPGPRPQSRETAILMLADGCEARVRAERPRNEDEVRILIKSVIEQRMSSGQLDDTDLTLRDLEKIQDSFTATLRGIYHPRIEYPRLEKKAQSEAETLPRGIVSSSEHRSFTEPTRPVAESRKPEGEFSKQSPEAAEAGPGKVQPATQESGR